MVDNSLNKGRDRAVHIQFRAPGMHVKCIEPDRRRYASDLPRWWGCLTPSRPAQDSPQSRLQIWECTIRPRADSLWSRMAIFGFGLKLCGLGRLAGSSFVVCLLREERRERQTIGSSIKIQSTAKDIFRTVVFSHSTCLWATSNKHRVSFSNCSNRHSFVVEMTQAALMY